MTPQAQAIQDEMDKKTKEISELYDKFCGYCDGEGEVIAREKINSATIDIPYKLCPECGGSGVRND